MRTNILQTVKLCNNITTRSLTTKSFSNAQISRSPLPMTIKRSCHNQPIKAKTIISTYVKSCGIVILTVGFVFGAIGSGCAIVFGGLMLIESAYDMTQNFVKSKATKEYEKKQLTNGLLLFSSGCGVAALVITVFLLIGY
jgi:hypothetical protein